ncbi:MAG TPA: CRISPR-associated helicase Cas3' [Vicinamibacterales bacterium]
MPPDRHIFFWAKARRENPASAPFHPIACHSLDVAAVVAALLDARPQISERLVELLGIERDACCRLLVALASLHDLGKFAPAFQCKAPEHWPTEILGPLDSKRIAPSHHTDDGYRLWECDLGPALADRLWPNGKAALDILAIAVFGHHGRPISPASQAERRATWSFGSGHSLALECAADLISLLQPTPVEHPAPRLNRVRAASWIVAGLLTVADWIGSREKWFPYECADPELDLGVYWERVQRYAGDAIAVEGLTAPRAAPLASFAELTESSFRPTPAQAWASETALPDGQLLCILEDVTGSGKTEAAQMLVHRLMASGRATGAYWAMPTQATANAMYKRQAKAIERLFAPDESSARPSLVLAHGQSSLHERFRSTVIEPSRVDVAEERVDDEVDEPSSVLCAEFFANDRRAALLADIGAGTIDQALLGVLPTRFNAMRLFGLIGKVLIVDEAHAYDAYMSGELETLLTFHAALGGSAIVLSATLPKAKRQALVRAWARGMGDGRVTTGTGPVLREEAYPLATIVGGPDASAVETRLELASWSRRAVTIRFLHSESDALDRVVAGASAGAAVVWIRNTVRDCLSAATALHEHGIDPMVFHARFAQCDRQRREREVLKSFDNKSAGAVRRRVLVATQVVEQSLDLDFDVMISDVAPIDLLIQRAGRLWRHQIHDSERPSGLAPELFVVSPPVEREPEADWIKAFLPGTNAVYDNTGVLWRSARILAERGAIVTDGGLRELIEAVYDSDEVPEALRAATDAAMGRDQAATSMSRFQTLMVRDGYHGGARPWEDDLRAVTRLGRPQTTLRLAMICADGRLVPWAGEANDTPWKAWALSEVRVSAARVPPDVRLFPEFQAWVEAARSDWRRFDENIPILPLANVGGDEWVGSLIRGGRGAPIRLRYTTQQGLDFA